MTHQSEAKRVRVTFTVDSDLLDQVDAYADQDVRSRASALSILIRRGLASVAGSVTSTRASTASDVTVGKKPEDLKVMKPDCQHERTKTLNGGIKCCLDCEATKAPTGVWRI